jgi:hypothetical protein
VASALEPDRLQSTATSVIEPTSTMPDAVEAAMPADSTIAQLAAEASATFDRMDKAQREGNWARYGEEQKRLREIIDRMNAIKK